MKTALKDEVLEEIWRVKDALAAKHDYDLDAIFQELHEKEKHSKHRVIDLSKPRPKSTAKKR